MMSYLRLLLIGIGLTSQTMTVHATEEWKGPVDTSEFSFGGMIGLGIIDNQNGFTILPTISKKIIHQGFVPDINNTVSVEAMVGPLFLSDFTAGLYSLQLRWDFEKDAIWTFYAVGGLGGNWRSFAGQTTFVMTPRLGVGAFYAVTPSVRIRGEIAHDLIGVGVNVPLYL